MSKILQNKLLIFPIALILLLVLLTSDVVDRYDSTTDHISLIQFDSILNAKHGHGTNTHQSNITTDIILQKQNWSLIYYQKPRKTGGTSFAQLLKNNGLYDGTLSERCFWLKRPEPFTIIKPRCISTHHKVFANEFWPFFASSYLKYKHELWSDVLLMTLLRDPIDRIFSDMLYRGHWRCHDIDYERIQIDLQIEDKLIDCLYRNHAKFTQNIYSKTFSGVWPYALENSLVAKQNIDFNPNMVIDELQYEMAKLIINEFDIIMILEMWEQTSVQLKCYGISDNNLPHANVGKMRAAVDQYKLVNFPTLKRHIVELNEYDIKLYQFATEVGLQKTNACNAYLMQNHTSS